MKHFVLSFLLIAGLINQVKSSFSNNLPPITHTPATKRGVHPLTYNSISSYVKAPKYTALKGLNRFATQDKLAGKIVYTDTTITSANARQGNGAISSSANPAYTLDAAARTSAGIYDGDVLVRTLWNNEQRSAGTYDLSTVWDGKDDNGNNVADKNYTIKVVSNNVTYDWLRPIGNTSDSSSGPSVHHSMQMYTNMVQVGNNMYCANGYNEVGDSHLKFPIGQPNRLTTTLKGGTMVPRFIASDGVRVYYAGQARGGVNFTTAITPNPSGTDAIYSFSSGRQVRITGNNDYQYSAIDYDSLANFPSGLAVQQTGNKLLVSHPNTNELRVLNKVTGAFIATNTINNIRGVALQDNNTLWALRVTPHTGSTTSAKLSGTQIGSESIGVDVLSRAFDGVSNTYFRTTGGSYNYVGLNFSSLQVITQVRAKSSSTTSFTANILGYNGWESVQLGTITSTNGSWATVNISNTNPFKQIKIDNHDGPQMYFDEVEFYGYSYSGLPVVSKYTLNSDGKIGSPILTLTGITEPLALAVSPDGAKLAVADRGTYHQVKFFNTATGALLSTLGRAETYDNPTVYDDKFYFTNTKIFREDDYGTAHAFVAYQTDGSLWVGDYGNMRCQHFSSSNTYLNNIQFLGYSYNTQVDANNPSRAFSNFLEFSVDYANNAWSFVRNWTKTVQSPREFEDERFRSVATLSNGRTYALFVTTNSGPREVIELVPATGVRHTGVFMDTGLSTSELYSDGSQWQRSSEVVGQSIVFKRKPLSGFDGNNNPVWGSYVTLETTPALLATDPLSGIMNHNQLSSTGVLATFNADNGNGAASRGLGYHLGGIKNGQWQFKTSKATRLDYTGDYPNDGAYDIGNGVNNAGSFMQVVDRNIFWGYKGEFWKAGQTNMHNHYLDNGLMVGQFGVPGDIARTYGEAAPMMAGNANTGTYVKVGNDIHLFHPDESHHSAIHHWKISNLGSIKEITIPVTKASVTNPPVLDYVDLMNGVPISTTLAAGVGRWTYSPALSNTWKAQAGLSTYKQNERSMRFTSYPTVNGLTREAYCNLSTTQGVLNNYSGWQITGLLMYPEIGEPFDNFLEVIDNSGKIIVRISRPQLDYPNVSVKANSTTIVPASSGGIIRRLFQNAHKISIRRIGNNILVNYAGYPEVSVTAFDPTANLNSPTTLRIHFYSADTRGHQIDLANLRFYSTPTVVNGTGTGLAAEYFNNRTLTAPVSATRTDATVNFNWSVNSPIPGTIGVDDFSVRWSGQVQAPVSGDYVFSTTCDDGVRLWVNGVLVINNWAYHSSTDNSAPITLTAGQKYDIKLEYYEGLMGAKISLLWAYPGQSQQTIPKERLYPATLTSSGGIGTGLAAQYYNNRTLTAPVSATRTDATVNFNWSVNSPIPGTIGVDDFSVRWSGQVQAPVSGDYVFSTTCDDGVRLWVNGVLVINNWAYHSSTDNSAPITLTAGQKYDIKLEYYEGLMGAKISLLWAYPGQSQQTIPKERLYPATLTSSGGRLRADNSEIDVITALHVYPIPAQDFFWVQYYAKEAGDVLIRLVNENAQSVLQSVHQVTQGENILKISVTGLTRGIYLINLMQGSGRVSQRVILSN